MNKYELTGEILKFDGRILYRVKALSSFGDVSEGDLGGSIENESNLSQENECWIYDNVLVYDKAVVCENAKIYDNSIVAGNATISGNVKIRNEVWISQDAKIFGNSILSDSVGISGNSKISGDSKLSDEVSVYGNAVIFGNAIVSGKVKISDYAVVSGNSRLSGLVKVHDRAFVTGNSRIKDNVDIFDFAKISGNSRIESDVKIYGNSEISGDTYIHDSASVHGHALVCDKTEIYGHANIGGNSNILGNAKVYDAATILGDSKVEDNAEVYGSASISDYAQVFESSKIFDFAQICGKAKVKGNARISGYEIIDNATIDGDTVLPKLKEVIITEEKICEKEVKGIYVDDINEIPSEVLTDKKEEKAPVLNVISENEEIFEILYETIIENESEKDIKQGQVVVGPKKKIYYLENVDDIKSIEAYQVGYGLDIFKIENAITLKSEYSEYFSGKEILKLDKRYFLNSEDILEIKDTLPNEIQNQIQSYADFLKKRGYLK